MPYDPSDEPETPSATHSRMPRAALRELEPLRDALSGLSEEIRAQQRRALKPQRESGAGIEWDALFDELRRRVGTLGMVERDPAVDDFGMQADFVERLTPLLEFLYERYWRVDFLGENSLPSRGPVLFVANRSGVLSWDGMMLSHAIDRCDGQLGRPRFLVEDALLRLPFAQAQLARVGGVRACRENVEQLISRGHSVIAFPEGERVASRSFRQRYQVADFASGDQIAAAIEARIPLVPVGIVGAEEAYPRLGDISTLAKLVSRELKLPALPITPIFPLLGPLGLLPLPSKWVIALGDPISASELGAVGGDESLAGSRPGEVLRGEVRRLVERALDARSSSWN